MPKSEYRVLECRMNECFANWAWHATFCHSSFGLDSTFGFRLSTLIILPLRDSVTPCLRGESALHRCRRAFGVQRRPFDIDAGVQSFGDFAAISVAAGEERRYAI